MEKLKLKDVADEFEMIADESPLFYNTQTGEFEFYIDPAYSGIDADAEKYESDEWIATPSKFDIHEYSIMEDFAESVSDPRQRVQLQDALRGSAAFRRFKAALDYAGLREKWYAFKREAFVEIARSWCEENELGYVE